jgi:hypothetical protein
VHQEAEAATGEGFGDVVEPEASAAPERREGFLIMQKWEYFVAPLLEHNPGEILNTFGDDGWELVSVAQIQNPMGGQSLVAYMKRPKA